MRLVAFMQYLRIVVVVGTASVVGRLAGGTGVAHATAWLAPIAWPSFAATCALVLAGGVLVPRYRIAKSPLFVTLVAAVLLQNLTRVRLELPPIALGASYAVLGWAIGMRFTREILVHVRSALPRVLAAIATLVGRSALNRAP